MTHLIYLIINLVTILGPLVFSFDKKVAFYKNWKYVGIGIFISSTLFLFWDILFTRLGIWGFNLKYITGVFIYNLPWEEILFFVCIPYACLFIYECLKIYFPNTGHPRIGKIFGWLIVILSTAALIYKYHALYSSITAILLLVTFLNHLWITRGDYLNHLMVAWLVSIIPMALIDGLLTGLPIIHYNYQYTLGFRIGSIPIEDFFYNLLYLTWMVWVYERYKQRPHFKAMSQKK